MQVDGGGFEPPKALLTDLQSAPFGHSGIHPYDTGYHALPIIIYTTFQRKTQGKFPLRSGKE